MGAADDVKAEYPEGTLFGRPWDVIFSSPAGVVPEDIWRAGEARTLWNARVHVIVSGDPSDGGTLDLDAVLGWARHPSDAASLTAWAKCDRTSLAEMLGVACAKAERAH